MSIFTESGPVFCSRQLVYKIFGLEPFKKEAEKLVHEVSKKFTDYRNKYNEAIILFVKDMQVINYCFIIGLIALLSEFIFLIILEKFKRIFLTMKLTNSFLLSKKY